VKGNKVTPGTKKAAPAGLTADQVIDKYLKTIGGREKLGQVKDLTMKMSASVQGMALEVVQQRKAPNKAKMIMQAQGMEVFNITSDGKRAVMSQMGNQQEMSGPELEAVKVQNTLFAELYYDQMSIKRSLAGTETVEGKEAYKVELEMPGGTKVTEYYDAATGLKIRVVGSQNTPEGAVTQSTDLGDYKEVNGVQYPHTITTSIGPQQIKMQVTGIEVNKDLADSLFEVK
jgi:outer membrane lipoprotein-sorting protein